MEMSSFAYSAYKNIKPSGCQSSLRVSPGFLLAAFIHFQLIVIKAIVSTITPAVI